MNRAIGILRLLEQGAIDGHQAFCGLIAQGYDTKQARKAVAFAQRQGCA